MIKKRKTIVLQVTEDCNLNCSYCYQNHKEAKSVSLKSLTKIVDDGFKNLHGYEEIEFDFIGGEPLIEFDLIKQVCEWTWSHNFNTPCIFFISTNGTLLNKESKEWLAYNHERIWLGLSMDGTREMHNENRCNSYDLIDIPFLLENWPLQPVKMTVSPNTLPQLAEGVIHIHELGFKVTANLAYGVDWNHNDYVNILTDELEKLVIYYLNNPEIEPIMLLNLPLHNLNSKIAEKYCGAGTEMEAYDIKTDQFPCHMFFDISMTDRDWQKIEYNKMYKNYYANCKYPDLFNICPICVGMNYTYSKDQYNCDPYYCNLMVPFFKINSYFQAQKILKDNIKEKDAFLIKKTIEGIKLINSMIKTEKI